MIKKNPFGMRETLREVDTQRANFLAELITKFLELLCLLLYGNQMRCVWIFLLRCDSIREHDHQVSRLMLFVIMLNAILLSALSSICLYHHGCEGSQVGTEG